MKSNTVNDDYNWEAFFGLKPTRIELLQRKCVQEGISIYLDNPTGSHASDIFRQPASEAELQNRLGQNQSSRNGKWQLWISIAALLLSLIGLFI